MRARVRLRRPAAWEAFLGIGALLCAAYVAVPGVKGTGPLMNLLGLAPVIALGFAARRQPRGRRGPWNLFLIGFALFWVGDLYTYSYPKLLHRDVPFPSIGDAAYVLVYPALMAGLLLLVRRRNAGTDRAALIDSLIMTLGLALVSWVALIAPYLHDPSMDLAAKLVSVAYPLGDVLLLAAAIRLAVDTGRRQGAFYLMASSIVALLLTDFLYGLATLHGTYHHQLSLDVGWISFYLLWGAAALHPSAGELQERAPVHDSRLSAHRLALLTAASLIAPGLELARTIRGGDPDLMVIIAASAVLFGLVVARMTGLVRQQEHSVARERILTRTGAALVAATSVESIQAAALEAIHALAGEEAEGFYVVRDQDELRLLVSSVDAAGAPRPLAAATARELLAKDPGECLVLGADLCADLELAFAAGHGVTLELPLRGLPAGLLVVARPKGLAAVEVGALRSLATEVALALESVALTEEVHRRTSEARLSSLVQHSSDLITVLDTDATVSYQSPSIQHVLGYTPEEIVGTRFDRLLVGEDAAPLLRLLADGPRRAGGHTDVLECSLRHRDGSVRQFEIQYTNLLEDEAVNGVVLNARDVSERRAFEQQLEHQAFHDPVTGLANRALFVERVRHAVARVRREGRGLAVVFMDLDDFKTINDSLGHAAGDEVLIEVARRLDASVRAVDTAARFGGDEFAVLLEDVASADEAASLSERILESLTEPLQLDQKQLLLRASLGIAAIDAETPGDAEELIRNADAAMYIAKRDGKGGYRLFEPGMHAGVLARLELRADLQRALTTGQLELFYQPVVRLSDGDVSGVEALLRWRHPERGIVGPDEFVPLAEEMGLIVPIGRWVLREGCRQARLLQQARADGAPLTMSVNLSVKQLQNSDIVADVRDALAESGLDPALLTLEITETVMMSDMELAILRLQELKQLGVRLAMDDFGTGYSSLSYLSRLPVDILKMDRSFLRAGASPQASGLATAVVALGETLELDVVAEGIEYSEQWDKLRELGCDLGQGYLFAKPMDAHDTSAFLSAQAAPPAAATDAA